MIKLDALLMKQLASSVTQFAEVPLVCFTLGIVIPFESFIVNKDFVVAKFVIESRNAILCGSEKEISVHGKCLHITQRLMKET